MAIFPFFKQKEKPDIPKDAPKKKGIMLVLSTVWREFFNLLKLNWIFLLSCLPIVTIPAAIKAMSRITIVMVRDETFFLWHDYWEAFKDDFWKSFFGGLIYLLGMAVLVLSALVYGHFGLEVNWAFLLMASFSIALLIWAYLASLYFYPMNAYVKLPFGKLLINSVILVFTGWKRSGLAFLSALLFIFLPILLMPYSVIFILFISFPLTNLLVSFALYPVIEKRTVALEKTEEAETVGENDDKYISSPAFTGWTEEEEIKPAAFTGWDDEPETKEETKEEKKDPEEAPEKDAPVES